MSVCIVCLIDINIILYLCSGDDKTIILWDLGTGKRTGVLTGHSGTIFSLDFSKEGTVLASGSGMIVIILLRDYALHYHKKDILSSAGCFCVLLFSFLFFFLFFFFPLWFSISLVPAFLSFSLHWFFVHLVS